MREVEKVEKCKYCGKYFCPDHIYPEIHQCEAFSLEE